MRNVITIGRRSKKEVVSNLESIRTTVQKHFSQGRSKISRILCEEWELMVRPISRGERRQWRGLVQQFHYLGDQVIAGKHLLIGTGFLWEDSSDS